MSFLLLGIPSSQTPASAPSSATLIGTFSGDDVSLSLTISDIPQTYKHLYLQGHLGQTGSVNTLDWWEIKINGGTGINIKGEGVYEASAAMVGIAYTSAFGEITNWNYAGGYQGNQRHFPVDTWLTEYSNTGQTWKGLMNFNGTPNDLNGKSYRFMGYHDASSVTSLTITTFDYAIASYSKLYLYGVE